MTDRDAAPAAAEGATVLMACIERVERWRTVRAAPGIVYDALGVVLDAARAYAARPAPAAATEVEALAHLEQRIRAEDRRRAQGQQANWVVVDYDQALALLARPAAPREDIPDWERLRDAMRGGPQPNYPHCNCGCHGYTGPDIPYICKHCDGWQAPLDAREATRGEG